MRSGAFARWCSRTVLGLVLGAAGCDPLLRYAIRGDHAVRADGDWYVLKPAAGVEARFAAHLFTGTGTTDVQVVNRSDSPLEFHPTPTLLTTADGKRVEPRCQLPREPRVVIARGETLAVRCTFDVQPRGFRYEPRFSSLTVDQPGITWRGKSLAVVAQMNSAR